ncbi:hypothetical protein D1007_05636 [Hordeum vulgare]|nr:hypothetical protein D1007_05636 [Hordeum vulgare]
MVSSPPPCPLPSRPLNPSPNPLSSQMCFACHQPGHFQSRCLNPPFCLICRSEGHLTVDSQNHIKPPSFVQYGLGLPGCSFFALDCALPHVATTHALSNADVIYVQGHKITPQVLLEGLRVWVVDGWDWQVTQLSEFEFSVVFPSPESLRMIASFTNVTLPFNQLVIFVKAAANGFKSVGHLCEVWVLVEDAPTELRSVPFLMAFGILLGKPIGVDGESLARLGPVRLKIWCVDPVCLHRPVDVFPSADGMRLHVRLKGAEASEVPPPPTHHVPSSSEKRDDGAAGGRMNPSGRTGGGIDARFTQSEWDRLGPEVQDVLKNNAPKDDVQHVETVLAAAVNEKYAPVGTPISGVCSNMPVRPLSPSKSSI